MHLGATWPHAALGERETEAAARAALVAEARRRPSPAAAAALAACRLVLPDAELDAALEELGLPLPHWADDTAPVPQRASRAGDPWRADEVWVLGYADHALLAALSHPGGTVVQELAVVDLDALAEFDEATAQVYGGRTTVPVEVAVREVRSALRWADLTWPREPSESYAQMRLLAHARLRPLAAVPDPEPLSEPERQRLREAFLGPHPDEGDQDAVELFLDYGDGYLREPLLWSPDDVLLFLLDWVPRKVVLEEVERAGLPDRLARWVAFALEQAGLEGQWHEPVVTAVHESADEFHQLYTADSGGPARQLATALSQAGVDLADEDAVRDAVGAFNARRRARTALLAGGVPEGAAVRLTVTLLDVTPPVWRRLVVPADVTLARLHALVQAAMGWEDSHLHEWYAAGETYGTPDRDAPDVRDERKVRLGDLLARVDRLAYLYDFGDSWRHEVVLDEVLLGDETGEVPRLEAGARACPPEDVGGGPGYDELLDGLAGRGSEWAQEVAESYEGFDPERFDLAELDRYVRSR